MAKSKKIVLFLTRVAFGWFFIYAGLTKITNPDWTAQGYIESAKTFPEYYAWLAQPHIISWVDLANQWGLLAIGIGLVLGLWMRWVALAGFALMLLYYFPTLEYPYVDHGYIIDSHIIYALLFLVLWLTKAGTYWGVEKPSKEKKKRG